MLNKVLIFVPPVYSLKTSDGGPSGFIAQNILGHSSKYYQISVDLPVKSKNYSLWDKVSRKFKHIFGIPLAEEIEKRKKRTEANLNSLNEFRWWGESSQQHFSDINAQDYKFIFFHDVWTMKACIPLLSPSQIIILQPHCPELPSQEIASQARFSDGDIKWSVEAERDAFDRANILVLPNSYTVEIYKSLITNKSKIHYLLSGAQQRACLHKYPLNDKIHLLYIGRRNYIKGFDIVLKGFQHAYASRKDIELIIVGKGEKIDKEGIYDIGFTDSVHDWIYSCDYIINCNRQSYFDLSILEALSIGIPIIASCTGGHEQFREDNAKGIIDIGKPSPENIVKILLSSEVKKKFFNEEQSYSNRQLYLSKYSDYTYRKNLENLLSCIIEENS